ncbi:hypothetical protein BC629DRAFT_1636550 [Irpex lacteus]|nr:hypothetical protein BC629DRAFT_1636550 [Irpex lacteus]
MDSSTVRRQNEERKQAEIRRQIAALQAQLKEVPAAEEDVPATPKKRKQQSSILAPGTPSPSTRNEDVSRQANISRPAPPSIPRAHTIRDSQSRHTLTKVAKPAAPSTVLSKLASLSTTHTDEDPDYTQVRSEGFLQRAPAKEDTSDGRRATRREEDLTVIEDLEPGPYEHKAPFDDPHFQKLEPHSGIRLSSRAIPHDEFQDYLRGRYYLSPSRLYSVIRLLPSKQGYDVPVEGDWVTIAVIAERGPLRYSKAPVDAVKEEAGDDLKSLSLDAPPANNRQQYQNQWKGKAKAKEEPSKPSGKRYINLKLIDFGCRSSSSATSQKSTIRGDAFLSLLLFESDGVEEATRVDDEGKERMEKVYRGGSRGAFERMAKLKEGSVVALLNPKILRPFQRATDTPHPTDNILALTPLSLSSVCIIGHSLDLGMCAVVKRDGKACGSWCDKRVSEVCEWHVQHAVQGKRAGRAEFSMGTSGMTTAPKRKPAYDPSRQWGLQPSSHPSSASADATYIVSGHIVSNSTSTQSLFVSESVGRDAQAKAARKAKEREEEGVLMEGLRRRDREGVRVLWAAREFAERAKVEAKGKDAKGKGRPLEASDNEGGEDSEEGEKEEGEEGKTKLKSAYSATLIRTLGFDPTGKRKGATAKDVQDKLSALASIHAKKKVGDVRLGPRPGGKRSSVVAPPEKPRSRVASPEPSLDFPDSSESDEELRRGVSRREAVEGKEGEKGVGIGMVNLDSSDVE